MTRGTHWAARGIALASVVFVAGSAATAAAVPESADLVLIHGHVKTPTGWAQALAVRKGVIVALGDDHAVEPLRGSKTHVVNLGGDTVLPGLHDIHVHPIFAGISEQQCKIPQGLSLPEAQKLITACAARIGSGEWIVGGQWDASALGRVPDRASLDAVSKDHPALLDDTSGHSSWANSRALAIAGITRATPNPKGGIIERDSAGEPTGILREGAIELVRQHVPKPSEEAVRTALKWATHEMLSFGITSYTEASVGFVAGNDEELEAYAALANDGVLKQRATLCLTWAPGSAEAEAAIAARNLYARPRVAPDCVKIFLDGVPTDGHTAAMLEPYVGTLAGRDDEAARMGMLLVKQDELDAAVTRFDRMGLTVKFHAAGDAAVRAGLSAIAAARKADGFNGLMHNVGHCTFVAPEDIARAREHRRNIRGVTLPLEPEPDQRRYRGGGRSGGHQARMAGTRDDRIRRPGRAGFRLERGPFRQSLDRHRNLGDARSARRRWAFLRQGRGHFPRAGHGPLYRQCGAPGAYGQPGRPYRDRHAR